MTLIKPSDSKYLIPMEMFNSCLIDKITEEEIRKKYNKAGYGPYYLNKFEFHLKQYNINLKEYCIKYLNIEWPKCPITNKDLNYRIRGQKDGLHINQYHIEAKRTKQNSEKVRNYCQKFSQERKGENNPMFGKAAWNKGLDRSNPIINQVAENRIGIKLSEESKQKMREARARSPKKARHDMPHSKETCEKMRLHTANLWATGVFKKVTSIHIKMREFLKTLNLKETPTEEYQVKYWCLDFAFPVAKIGIECQGTYFHIDPRIYPDGPKDNIQRRNFGRDKAKKKHLEKMGWIILESWETEINDGTFKDLILCKLKELNLLNQ